MGRLASMLQAGVDTRPASQLLVPQRYAELVEVSQCFEHRLFTKKCHFKNKASVALSPLISLIARLVSCSGRKHGNRQTDGRTDGRMEGLTDGMTKQQL